jgi:hypothetical protein
MKIFRKIFNIPTKKQEIILSQEYDKILQIAEDESSKHYNKEYEYEKRLNNICPRCRATNIVDKIAQVKGEGSISGSFVLGSGSVYGSSSVDTNGVNHCNNCGHQWKKYQRSFLSKNDILIDWVNDIVSLYTRDKTFDLLKDFSAESIWKIYKTVSSQCYYSTRENISLSLLRKKFKSIYK